MPTPFANGYLKMPATDFQATYPWCQVEHGLGGDEWIRNHTPGKEHIRILHPYGSHEETSADGSHRRLAANKSHNFVSNGHSHVNEGPGDWLGIGGKRSNQYGDEHRENGGTVTSGAHGQRGVASLGTLHSHTGGNRHVGTKGSVGRHTEGSDAHHGSYVSKDQVTFHGGNYYRQVGGEHGTHLPSGNMDIKLDGGKYQLNCGSDIMLRSTTKITLKVGSSSIVMDPNTITLTQGGSSITIKGSDISINSAGTVEVHGAGVIDVRGSQTKVQGGGTSVPPFTVG